MRGKVRGKNGSVHGFGITPAYAGKRLHGQLYNITIEDHPRLCGEKYVLALIDFQFKGSPPPMRGKATVQTKGTLGARITPAYAGKRGQLSDSIAGQWDHPRLCGEKST